VWQTDERSAGERFTGMAMSVLGGKADIIDAVSDFRF